ncbi:hypothetical protein N0B16_09455 [Chryseobacterium sp. GMJ5]|uniref:Uncharacterized protein n=1 Tax=Chryseobacterium gilvum TaxID=2976534 RepID=A0ABT2W030_9FLAO|nr:hypothetical protein [Chryseobacterium gilvum]MCU7614659.1 hypothetical protein [Chryseobacterium gilvum]
MMNTRVLELLKNPKNIQSEDIALLKNEINSFPYIQNIRALHLYGVHLYDKENYQKVLSTTAAYTTDKKILYQLINGKTQQQPKLPPVEKQPEAVVEATAKPTEQQKENDKREVKTEENRFSPKHDYEAAALKASQSLKPIVKHITVDGERNRILFPGEENFLNEDHNETIDLESTLESGVIVTQKSSPAISEEIVKNDEQILKDTDSKENSFSAMQPETSEKPIQEENIPENAETIVHPELTINEEKNFSDLKTPSEISFHVISSLASETEASLIEEKPAPEEKIAPILNTERIIEDENITSEKTQEEINTDSELSFHGTDSFLPEVKIEAKVSENIPVQAPQKSYINKHEDEMRRLIEEVEKKMKAKKEIADEKKEVQEETMNHEISFSETQSFEVIKQEEKPLKTEKPSAETSDNAEKENAETIQNTENIPEAKPQPEAQSSWKPMRFESHTPDAFIGKSQENPPSNTETLKIGDSPKQQNIVQEAEEKVETPVEDKPIVSEDKELTVKENDLKDDDEVPVMNVSFFGSDIASLGSSFTADQKQKTSDKKNRENNAAPVVNDSNVPGFINTWQNWLKIDRTEETLIDKTEIKNKVIESFIENNPKISQLKDEVSFVVKEKTDDISHLMTETLANLYIEQKLYSKAVNAFLILSNKFPDKKEYFEERIKEIKDNRNKN